MTTTAIALLAILCIGLYCHARTLRTRLDAAHSRLVGEKQRRLMWQQRATDDARHSDELERRNSYLIMESVAIYDDLACLEAENAYLRSHFLHRKGLVAGVVLVEQKRMSGKLEIVGEVSAP